jgi:hypothetical protein
MQELFTQLTRAVEGTWFIALLASFVWGILSIILSPCHLASIPLIVGFIDEQGRISTKRAFWISTLFAVGILITIAAIGAITAAAGRMMGNVGKYGNYFVAVIFFLVGLHLLGVIPAPWSGPGQVGMKRKGLLAALILGLVFGIALGRALLGDYIGGDVYGTGAALYELERKIQRRRDSEKNLWCSCTARRHLSDLCRPLGLLCLSAFNRPQRKALWGGVSKQPEFMALTSAGDLGK